MDKLNQKILRVLDWQGRESTKQIAKKVRSNKNVVAARIKKMEEEGIIEGYYTLIDYYKLNYYSIRVSLELEEMRPKEEQTFLKYLVTELKVGNVYKIHQDRHRYGIHLWLPRDPRKKTLEDTVKKIKSKLGKKFLSYKISFINKRKYFPKCYILEENKCKNTHTIQRTEMENYDELDFSILNLLANNARRTTVEIGKKLNTAQSTIFHRIKSMEKRGIIKGYRAKLNQTKLGYTSFLLEVYITDIEQLPKIEAWASNNIHVNRIQKTLGAGDIELFVDMPNREELENFLNKLKEEFPSVRKINYHSLDYKKLRALKTK